MNKSLISIFTASMLLSGVTAASAQVTSTTTTTWTTEQGVTFREYSTTKKYDLFVDPTLKPSVGSVVPGGVILYPLPPTMSVPDPDTYSYSIINNQPVVVDRTSRRVIYKWE